MKRFSLLPLLFLPTLCFAVRYYPRMYEEIGLPSGNAVTSGLKIGIPLLIVGIVIAYIFMWSKSDEEKKEAQGWSVMGCLGLLSIGAGFICLLPLLSWMEFAFVSIWELLLCVAIIGFITYKIYEAFKH